MTTTALPRTLPKETEAVKGVQEQSLSRINRYLAARLIGICTAFFPGAGASPQFNRCWGVVGNATILLGGSSLVDDDNDCCSVFTLGRADEVTNGVFGQGKEITCPGLRVSEITLPEGED